MSSSKFVAVLSKKVEVGKVMNALAHMTVGGWEAQVEKSKVTPRAELEYYGICMLGEKSELDELTKKFSLWM